MKIIILIMLFILVLMIVSAFLFIILPIYFYTEPQDCLEFEGDRENSIEN